MQREKTFVCINNISEMSNEVDKNINISFFKLGYDQYIYILYVYTFSIKEKKNKIV